MITTIEIEHSEQRIKADYRNDNLNIEVWADDNTYISDGLKEKEFEFEITKENAIKLARLILASYNAL